MRSMRFSTNVEAPGADRAWAAGITALVHALLLAGLLVHTMGERGTRHDNGGQEVVFTLTPQPPLPLHGPAPSAATEVSAASALHAPRAAAPGAGVAGPPRTAPTAPAPVEVAVIARPEPEAIREPALPPPAQGTAAQAEAGEQAAPRAAPAPAPTMVPASQGEGGGSERKTIVIQSMGSSVGSYTFPALAGIDERDMTELFTVETGDYPDLQTAMVNHVIGQIRARYPVEIKWDSIARGRVVTLSMRVEDHETLVKFLRVELFGKRRSTTY